MTAPPMHSAGFAFVLARLLVVCALCGPAPSARAEPPSPSAVGEAKTHYDRGVVSYNLGHFDEAIQSFTRAYELDPAPILLFNIAQAHWKKGENARALFFYRRYLDSGPPAEERARAEARIREIEAAEKESGAPAGGEARAAAPPLAAAAAPAATPALTATAPAIAPAVTRDERPLYRRGWFWGVAGAVVAATALTIVLISARGSDDWCRECNWSREKVGGP